MNDEVFIAFFSNSKSAVLNSRIGLLSANQLTNRNREFDILFNAFGGRTNEY